MSLERDLCIAFGWVREACRGKPHAHALQEKQQRVMETRLQVTELHSQPAHCFLSLVPLPIVL
jgi:hypothetical protein